MGGGEVALNKPGELSTVETASLNGLWVQGSGGARYHTARAREVVDVRRQRHRPRNLIRRTGIRDWKQ